LDGHYGYRKLAKKYNIPDKIIIRTWVKAFQSFGVDGIKKKQKKSNQNLSREKELELENENLRLENAYLKKLNAFRENPSA
ncbi:hypothetical protein K1Y23_13880, partial [Mammaliicoccus sciuri]|uniref:helix-turn-helix domain-containing protein n=1 Tax=Mammaliicoccus sciuri TaxID=1296 RepID=UPI002FC34B59|nr:hypothetical protein [Mammaliicoccus sciuri]